MTYARPAAPTVTFVDAYGQRSQDVFPDVRSVEHFKQLHVGMLSEIKRKTLPAIAKATGEGDAHALHHVVASAPWRVEKLRERRLTKLKQTLARRSLTLCIDETGDRGKGKTTDDVASPYIGNIGKIANGIVSVKAYGVLDHIPFPLLFSVSKPHTRLEPEDTDQTKPELAVEISEELEQWGFTFDVVLADCVSGESSTFISALEKRHLTDVLAIRSNHGAWLPAGSRIRQLSWRSFDRVFSNGEKQTRYLREMVFGWRGSVRFYVITIDPRTLPNDGTWFIITNLEGKIHQTVGNTSGFRTWIVYGFKQSKNGLGWADDRVTDDASIERWWERIFCAYPLVRFPCPALPMGEQESVPPIASQTPEVDRFSEHSWWDTGQGWKNILNNLRLILQPFIFRCLLWPWMLLFDLPSFRTGFAQLISIMNLFHARLPT